MVDATIEDLAITTRPSRESDAVRRRCCIEHDFINGLEIRAITGTEFKMEEIGVYVRSSELLRRAARIGIAEI